LEKAWNIPDDIQAYCGGLASDKKELASGCDQMQQLVTEINDVGSFFVANLNVNYKQSLLRFIHDFMKN